MPLVPRSSVAKKYFNALTGLGLVGFIITHLVANLLLLTGNPADFNGYAYKLHGFGPLLYVAEIGLALVFVAHIFSALGVHADKRKARPNRYEAKGNAGGNSKKTMSSSTMIVSGLLLMFFLVWHIITFRFGPGITEGYVVMMDGHPARDLYRLTVEYFQDPINVAIYVGVMVFLGFHLRHGFWSMFQSLGAHHPRYTKAIFSFGIVFGLLIALGFIVIPIWIYMNPTGSLIGGI